MRLDIHKFLKTLGASIADRHPQVNEPDGDPAAGFMCRCPLHQDSDRSMLCRTDSSGTARFRCLYRGCGFGGDAVSLLSMARKVSAREAVAMFRPGGEFAKCLLSPLGEAEAEAYLDDSGAQATLKTYLERCRRAFMDAPERAGISPGLSASRAGDVVGGVGFLVRDGVPGCLSEFSRPAYRNRTLVLYPSTANGDVASIEVRDPSDPSFSKTVQVRGVRGGVFGEGPASDAVASGERTLFVVTDPVACARLSYAASKLPGGSGRPVVSVRDLPLPDSFSGVSRVVLVATRDAPLPLGLVLSAAASESSVDGPCRQPAVRVASAPFPSTSIPPSSLASFLSSPKSADAAEWAVGEMASLASKGRMKEVADALSSVQIPPVMASGMAKYARRAEFPDMDAALSVAELLEKPVPMPSSDIVLANGRSVRRGPSSLSAVGHRGEDVLANVGLSVESKLVSSDGEEFLLCSVSTGDPDMPSVKASLPESAWSSPSKLQRIVSRAFASRGLNPYVAFYEAKGFSWSDILCRLSERCPVSREVGELGPDDVSDIQLPEFVVRSDGSTARQSRVFTLPDCVLRAYSGLSLPDGDVDWAAPWRELVAASSDLYAAAFALGCMHVLYQMTFGLFGRKLDRGRAGRHLFYVETEPGIWSSVFRQVSDMFSGGGYTPTLGYARPEETLSQYEKLGRLPLMAYVPTMGAKFSKALDSSTVDLIGLLDTTTAVMSNGKVSAVYVTPCRDVPSSPSSVSPELVARLRESFPGLLSAFVRSAAIDHRYRSTQTPCLAAWDECLKVLGVDGPETVRDIARTWFPGTGMNGVNMFFDMLHRGINETGRRRICVVNGPPQSGRSFTGRGQHVFVMKDVVLVSVMTVDVVNKAEGGMCEFSADQLGGELGERGMLLPVPEEMKGEVDPKRVWCLPRGLWETSVVRPPVQIPLPLTGGEQAVKPISM